MLDKLNIVIPMKAPSRAKQRLMGVLNISQREALALSLYRQTLRFFAQRYPQVNCLVVTNSLKIADIASSFGASPLIERQAKGLNAAIELATHWSLKLGYQFQMVVPADIAKLNCCEIDALFQAVQAGNQVVIARAKDLGTNALITTPPNAIEFQYGSQSALAHVQQAHINGLKVEVLDLRDLSQDIDLPKDLIKAFPDYPNKEYCYE
ncbi:2-phospho-L-lactate guanylyltransferase [Vibrio sp. Of14-4]|uniref:2-phospho-L-lactate guanylyltransferase n=1 Tax=Vibrio sp. Of14-4 TaxID=2724878 RepID=UPI001EF17749|nr:2-phospho-L-lactate guanylyltransferase [Vibrio sp. Of14-4]